MKRLAYFSLALLVAGSSAPAAIITGVTSSDTSVATISIGSESSTPITGSGVDDSATLTLDVTVLQNHVPVDFVFSYGADAGGGGIVTRQYDITFNLTNSIPTGGSNDYINGFDITNNGFTGALQAGLDGDTEPSGYFAFEDGPPPGSEYNQPNGFRFGGLNGGGPAMYNGDPVRTQFFSYVITASNGASGTATVTFTANPEPGTLALAGLALFPLGIAVRRRRRAAQQAEEV